MNFYFKLFFIFILILILPRAVFYFQFRGRIYSSIQNLPDFKAKTALVLGAAVNKEGLPTQVLADRVKRGVDLLKNNQVAHLLLSGRVNSKENEVLAMKNYALQLGAKEDQLLLDEAGARTVNSCKNAQEVFHLDQLIIISQNFHLPRSLYLCQHYGVEAIGVSADLNQYSNYKKLKWQFREMLATWKALRPE